MPGDSRQLFGAVANAGTDIVALIRRTLDIMGRTSDTEPTAFTDGCSSMRSILAEAGVTDPPILDWFHLSMRLQHAKQAAGGLPADGPDRVQARAAIAAEVERLRWRTWNGKAKDARITLERIHALLPSFEGEPTRKLRRALDTVDRYLRSQSAHLVDYAERHRAGLRVGTSLTAGTANFLVNRRMAKSQQMRWSRRGADLLLQVRCAVYNGTLGTDFQWPCPRIACCRQGPGSPAASARIQPVLRRSAPNSPSRNRPAEAATRSCVNNGRIRAFTSRNDAAHSSNVSSIDAPLIHPLPTIREKIRTPPQKCNCSARPSRL